MRVIRNITRDYKHATGEEDVSDLGLTAYERGRMKKSCTRLGSDLVDLGNHYGHKKFACFVRAYFRSIGANVGAFSQYNSWTVIFSWEVDIYSANQNPVGDFVRVLPHLTAMIDGPLDSGSKYLMLIKLSI